MGGSKIEILDLMVDIKDTTSGALQVLQMLRPEWKKEEIEIEVRYNKTLTKLWLKGGILV